MFWWRKKQPEAKGIFQVKVEPWFGKHVTVRAVAFENDDNSRGEMVANHIVDETGVVGFVLPSGRDYIVLAWADTNRDGKRGLDEPTATIRGCVTHDFSETHIPPYLIRLPGKGVPQKRDSGSQKVEIKEKSELDQLKENALKMISPDLLQQRQ
jgi:hypothetical protein